jgi:hypothetical protein
MKTKDLNNLVLTINIANEMFSGSKPISGNARIALDKAIEKCGKKKSTLKGRR